MKKIVIENAERKIWIEDGWIFFRRTGMPALQVLIRDFAEARLGREVTDAIRKQGKNPDGYWGIAYPGNLQIALPTETREDVLAAIKDWRSEDAARQSEAARVAALPENIERRAIDEMLERADRLENSPSEDNVSGPLRLRAEAERRFEAWKAKYPEAAAREMAADLLAEADHEDELALGALTYDADGWLSREDQEARAAEHRAKAAALRAKAAAETK